MAASHPRPPRPEWLRRPTGGFGWLDAHLLHDGWLARLGPDATALLVLLAVAADRHGASFYGRRRMAEALGVTRPALDRALARLESLHLLAHRPWRPGHPDGIWQLLPVPRRDHPTDTRVPALTRGPAEPLAIRAILARLGLET